MAIVDGLIVRVQLHRAESTVRAGAGCVEEERSGAGEGGDAERSTRLADASLEILPSIERETRLCRRARALSVLAGCAQHCTAQHLIRAQRSRSRCPTHYGVTRITGCGIRK